VATEGTAEVVGIADGAVVTMGTEDGEIDKTVDGISVDVGDKEGVTEGREDGARVIV